MAGVFISYRRNLSASPAAGRLYDWLVAAYGKERVFIDVATLEPGADFVDAIESAVGSCDALLAVIDPEWLTVADADGRPRLENGEDYVRLEIGAALERRVRVIPVLVQGASMPRRGELPEVLAALARRHAVVLSHGRWSTDLQPLLETLEKILKPGGVPVAGRAVVAATAEGDARKEARSQLSRLGIPYKPSEFVDRVKKGDLDAVRLFLAAGSDPDTLAGGIRHLLFKNRPVLLVAAYQGHGDVVRELLAAGADVDLEGDGIGWTPNRTLTAAIVQKHGEIAAMLVDAGANLRPLDLMNSVGIGRPQLVNELLAAGADIEERDSLGDTPLIKAASSGQGEVAATLIAAGANVEGTSNLGLTPLTGAILFGKIDLIRLLIEAGADLNSADSAGMTPLMCAVDGGKGDAIRLLLEAGADLRARDESGRTALSMALELDRPEIVELLRTAGADDGDAP